MLYSVTASVRITVQSLGLGMNSSSLLTVMLL